MISIQQQIKLVEVHINDVRIRYNKSLRAMIIHADMKLHEAAERHKKSAQQYMKEINTWVAVLESINEHAEGLVSDAEYDRWKSKHEIFLKGRIGHEAP